MEKQDSSNKDFKVFTLRRSSDDPAHANRSGAGDMALTSNDASDAMQMKEWRYRELEISESDIRAGRTRDAGEALSAIREKHGL